MDFGRGLICMPVTDRDAGCLPRVLAFLEVALEKLGKRSEVDLAVSLRKSDTRVRSILQDQLPKVVHDLIINETDPYDSEFNQMFHTTQGIENICRQRNELRELALRSEQRREEKVTKCQECPYSLEPSELDWGYDDEEDVEQGSDEEEDSEEKCGCEPSSSSKTSEKELWIEHSEDFKVDRNPHGGYDWMFWLDSDVLLRPDSLVKVLSCPQSLVGIPYQARWAGHVMVAMNAEDSARLAGCNPTRLSSEVHSTQFLFNPQSLTTPDPKRFWTLPARCVGFGATLVRHPLFAVPFRVDKLFGRVRGEDIGFCKNANEYSMSCARKLCLECTRKKARSNRPHCSLHHRHLYPSVVHFVAGDLALHIPGGASPLLLVPTLTTSQLKASTGVHEQERGSCEGECASLCFGCRYRIMKNASSLMKHDGPDVNEGGQLKIKITAPGGEAKKGQSGKENEVLRRSVVSWVTDRQLGALLMKEHVDWVLVNAKKIESWDCPVTDTDRKHCHCHGGPVFDESLHKTSEDGVCSCLSSCRSAGKEGNECPVNPPALFQMI